MSYCDYPYDPADTAPDLPVRGYINYTNLDSRFAHPYQAGDRLVRGWNGTLDDDSAPVAVVLERIFARHNRDNRPDGFLCPSMSVGDVIELDDGTWWSVASCGFVRIDQPFWCFDVLDVDYRTALATGVV